MAKTYKTLYDAVKAAQPALERDNALLDDGATYWDVNNLLVELYNNDADEADEADEYGYYIVGIDGSIGYTTDGYNIQWIYKAVAADAERSTARMENITE